MLPLSTLSSGTRVEVSPRTNLLTLTICPPLLPSESLFCHDLSSPEQDEALGVLLTEVDDGVVVFLQTSKYLATFAWRVSALSSVTPETTVVTIVGSNFGLTPWSTVPTPVGLNEGGGGETRAVFVTLDNNKLVMVGTNDRAITATDVKNRSTLSPPHISLSSITTLCCCPTPPSSLSSTLATGDVSGAVNLYSLSLLSDTSAVISPVMKVQTGPMFLPSDPPIPLDSCWVGSSYIFVSTSADSEILVNSKTGHADLILPPVPSPPTLPPRPDQGSAVEATYSVSKYSSSSCSHPCVYKASAFLPTSTFSRVPPVPTTGDRGNQGVGGGMQSLVSNKPPPKGSVLETQGINRPPKLPKGGTSMNVKTIARTTMGVTKSSGYGVVAPKMKLGQSPSTALKMQRTAVGRIKAMKRKETLRRMEAEYPVDVGPITKHQVQHDYPGGEGGKEGVGYCGVTFQTLSMAVAMVRNDGVVEIQSLPVDRAKRSGLKPLIVDPGDKGGDGRRERAVFSNTGGRNLLAYKDKVYSTERSGSKPTTSSLRPLVSLGEGSRNLCFFYGDKFLASSKGPDVHLHLYNATSGQTKRAASFLPSPSSHAVTSLGCCNLSTSFLLFTVHSDRSLHLTDCAVGKTYWTAPAGSGRRIPHSLALPCFSPNAGIPSDMCDLVACSSHDEGGLISLWDVRSGTPAARLGGGHVNRTLVCRANFSPCMRYVSTGSEDGGGAAWYDLRMGGGGTGRWNEGTKVKEGPVEEAAWSKVFPQVATAGGGGIRFYSAREL
ncbi:hypothetical protein TrCOL_g4085 [Triparma columacea]|uniref:Uncharacterized protein n=1 Tax=Triparma columacea TaxID=722753 RepID=A0A9W7GL48_9STRA|nr:hypothetical protein TrCOL_g4085 [Triparma columacea]